MVKGPREAIMLSHEIKVDSLAVVQARFRLWDRRTSHVFSTVIRHFSAGEMLRLRIDGQRLEPIDLLFERACWEHWHSSGSRRPSGAWAVHGYTASRRHCETQRLTLSRRDGRKSRTLAELQTFILHSVSRSSATSRWYSSGSVRRSKIWSLQITLEIRWNNRDVW